MLAIEESVKKTKARQEFSTLIARAGLTRSEVARAAGISTRTLDALARPEIYNRSGAARESTAWKIAHAFAGLTKQTPESAFDVLFTVEEEEAEP